jgi:hypothetical protein
MKVTFSADFRWSLFCKRLFRKSPHCPTCRSRKIENLPPEMSRDLFLKFCFKKDQILLKKTNETAFTLTKIFFFKKQHKNMMITLLNEPKETLKCLGMKKRAKGWLKVNLGFYKFF